MCPCPKHNEDLSPDVIYELIARVDFRKYFHLGGFDATKVLIGMCEIDATKILLDVGCASGKTACYIAKKFGCKVVGVDLLKGMVFRANERARREVVEKSVEFRVGDAQKLPFENNHFDIVIGEFITGLLEDKSKCVKEYLRVLKSGGTVGLNEATWIKTPVPDELVEYLSKVFGVRGEILTPDGWKEILEHFGLRNLRIQSHKANSLSNRMDDFSDIVRSLPTMVMMYLRSGTFRKFIKESVSIPSSLLEYFGYGIYVGQK